MKTKTHSYHNFKNEFRFLSSSTWTQPNDKPHVVALLSILRMAFLPALLICNTLPRHHIPVFIHSDYIFILLMCFFAFSNGYLANIAMIWAPKWVLPTTNNPIFPHFAFALLNMIDVFFRSVSNYEKEMASSIMAAFLGIGLAFGSSLSLIIVQLI